MVINDNKNGDNATTNDNTTNNKKNNNYSNSNSNGNSNRNSSSWASPPGGAFLCSRCLFLLVVVSLLCY